MTATALEPCATEPPPALWNPNAAACWSLLFSPAFGAFLYARNADTLGRADEARAHRIWFYVSLVFDGLVLLSVLLPSILGYLFDLAGLVLLFAWYGSLGKKQMRYVKDTWQDRYQRKSWTTPLLIGFAGLAAYFLTAFILEFAELALMHAS
jgi:hypothetical protein